MLFLQLGTLLGPPFHLDYTSLNHYWPAETYSHSWPIFPLTGTGFNFNGLHWALVHSTKPWTGFEVDDRHRPNDKIPSDHQ